MVNRYMYLAFAQAVILPLAWVVVWYDLDTSAMSESAFMTFVVSPQTYLFNMNFVQFNR